MKTRALAYALVLSFTNHWAEAVTCPAGSYNDNGVCKLADPGFYVPVAGAVAQTMCPVGTYTSEAGATAPVPASPGHYVSRPGAAAQTPCPVGTYAAGSGNAAPTPAQPGFYVPLVGAASQTPCAPGYFTAAPGMSAPTPAAPGFYVPASGASSPMQAPAGTYAPGPAATAFLVCPVGTYAPAGSAAAIPCEPGYFTSVTGAATPTPAPPGTFVNVSGASEATPAPPGTYAPGPAAKAPTLAPAGSFSPGNVSVPTLCPLGYYTPIEGMAAPLAAAPGYYVPQTGAASQTIVPAGNYAAGPAAAHYTQCPAGTYAPAGSAAPIPCPGGYFAAVGAATPTICPAGSFAPPGSAAPIQCPADFYAPQGSAAPIYCPGSPAGSTTCAPQNYNGAQLDFGDLPDSPYPTKLPSGARHVISPSIFLGAGPPDAELDGFAGATAAGDDGAGADDEDSVDPRALYAYKSTPFHLRVKCKNTTGTAAYLTVFIDWNNNGAFTDANEVQQVTVASSAAEVSALVHFNVPANAAVGTSVAMRLRFTTDQGINVGGLASDGEVEDYLLPVANSAYDWGDLPDSATGSVSGAWGSASIPDYRTRANDNGPVHPIVPGLWFANDSGTTARHIDAEADGQPNAASTGDNLSGDDDESPLFTTITGITTVIDGTRSYQNVTLVASLAVENITGTAANAFGFIDVNADGDFDDPGEQATPIAVPGDGSKGTVLFTFNFASPPMAPSSTTTFTNALRFRLSTDSALPADGPATNGEVEDALITYSLAMPNYNPEQDWGDLPIKYPTKRNNNGARHNFTTQLTLGYSYTDGELDGQPSANARGDDINSTFSSDETAFAPAAFTAFPGMPGALVPVAVSNMSGSPAQVSVFIDWNDDGDFNDLNEISRVIEPTGASSSIINVPFNVPATASATLPLAMRIRLSTQTGLGAGGLAPDGEVEDYFIHLDSPMDYGDLPSPYPTTYADNGPRHAVSQTLFIGATTPDLENDGQPTPFAGGDDAAGSNDEDGLGMSPPTFVVGQNVPLPVQVVNSTGSLAFLTAFVDWDNNGTFTGAETYTLNVPSTGAQTATFHLTVPLSTSTVQPLAVRLRLSTTSGLAAVGAAPDGEVEDYLVNVSEASLDFGDLPDGYKTTLASNGPTHVITAKLFLGSAAPDGEGDGLTNTTASGDDSNGSDDEDSLAAALVRAHAGFDLKLIVTATNEFPVPAYLYAFIDWDGDGVFNNTNEYVRTEVPAGSHLATVNPVFRVPLNATTSSPIAVRLRLSTAKVLASTGPALDGEVEDFFIPPAKQIIDYGDLQDGSTLTTGNGTAPGVVTDLSTVSQGDYRTMKNDLGPRHIARQDLAITLESQPPESAVDGEDDAHTSALADGDNNDKPALPNGGGPPVLGDDDENTSNLLSTVVKQVFDPATLTFTIAYYGNIAIRNETGSNAYLSAFMDSNNDGDFDDADEAALTIGASGATLIGGGLPNVRADLATTYATSNPILPPTAPGALPNAYGFVFVIKAQLPPTDTGIRGFTKKLPIRLRLSTTPGLGSINTSLADPIPDGEVEDHIITFSTSFDNPYPQPKDFGDLPAPYPTLLANDGARHTITPDLYIGANGPDAEADGQPGSSANGDDAANIDDEDGLIAPVLIAGGSNNIEVNTYNATGDKAYLWLFADWNHDGDFADAGEAVRRDALSGTRIVTFTVDLSENVVTGSPTAIRLRLSSEAVLGPNGNAPNGEVEDSFVIVHPQGGLIDFGDLPDLVPGSAVGVHKTPNPPDYKTKLSDGGPSHVITPGIGFANLTPSAAPYVDGELDAFQSTDAKGDDTSGSDDENGIEVTYGALSTTVIKDGAFSEAVVTVQFRSAIWNATPFVANTAHFFDTNNNGSFEDPSDTVVRQSFTSSALSTYPPGVGNVGYVFDTAVLHFKDLPPGGGFIERTFAVRSRISTDSGMTSIGAASNGEVEDHVVKVQFFVDPGELVDPDYGDLPDIYKTTHAVDGARHVITPTLYLGSSAPDGEADGNPSTNALGDDGSGSDDEDALKASLVDAHAGYDLPLAVRATNAGAGMAYLEVFADWNADGLFNNTDERVEVDVPPGSADVTFTALFRVPMNATTTQPIAVRLRLSSVKGINASGLAPNGEVEDYFIAPARQMIDYGDLNDVSGTAANTAVGTSPGTVVNLSTVTQGNYRTMKYNLGPRHIGRQDLSICLETDPPATQVDGEDDAHPNVNADGDDIDIGLLPNGGVSSAPVGTNDEFAPLRELLRVQFNPVTNEFTFMLFASVAIRNETGQPAYLTAFIDGNNDGDFGDTDETAITILSSGTPVTGAGPDFTISRPDASPDNLHTSLASIPSFPTGTFPPAYNIIFILKAKLPLVDTGIRGFTKTLPIRLRLSTTSGLGPNNTSLSDPIPDGEVEDHLVTFNASFDNPYPRIIDTISSFGSIKLWSDLVDKNSNTRFDGSNHFPPNFYQAFNNTWHFENGLTLQGNNPLVPASLMQNLPDGSVPYFHVANLFGQLAIHWGTVNFKNLGSYRAFMDQKQQSGEDSSPLGDIDGDDIPNFYEYAFGSDPTQLGSRPKFEPKLVTSGQGGQGLLSFGGSGSGGGLGVLSGSDSYFVLPYLRLTGGTSTGASYTVGEATYAPKASKNLSTWSESIESTTVPSGLPTAPAGYEWGAVRLPAPVNTDPTKRGFIRVELTTP